MKAAPREGAMFTGIISERGEVVALDRKEGSARLTVRGPTVTATAVPGGSIAVNGTCLTVTGLAGETFTAHVMGETLERTNLGSLAAGAPVNLERPLPANGCLDGHIVQGHVDGTGVITGITPQPGWSVVRVSSPPGLHFSIAKKGSIAVDGISLTVSDIGPAQDGPGDGWFEVSLIPETLERTTLGLARVGDQVNIEVDVIAKYVERLLARGTGI